MSSSILFASTVPSPHASRRLHRLLSLPLSGCLVDYLVELTIDVVNHGLGRPPAKHGRSPFRNTFHVKFRELVDTVIYRAQVTVPMLLTTAVYIARSKPFIQIARPDWAYERVFLGSLVVSTKYHNDRSLKNNHWAAATGVFSPRDIGRIEREMLEVLNFELRVEGQELLTLLEFLLVPTVDSPNRSRSMHDLWGLLPAVHAAAAVEVEETSRWSDSDSGSDPDTPSSSGDSFDSTFPVTPTTPLSLFPRPPMSTHPKRASYPCAPIPSASRAPSSC